jgi:arylsulfatase A-like enzyme
MSNQLSRRKFLKLLSLLTISGMSASIIPPKTRSKVTDQRANVVVLVFDTLSALHIPLHDYQRNTMPHLTELAKNGTVYHSHYSAGNFTMPGTASLLTGAYPWTHRGFHLAGSILEEFRTRNLFRTLSENQYTCFAFSQNMYATILLSQLRDSIKQLMLPRDVPLEDNNLADLLFPGDYATAIRSELAYFSNHGRTANSLFLDLLRWLLQEKNIRETNRQLIELFPRGVPKLEDIDCTLENTIDWLILQLQELPHPYFAYIHLVPPHFPYQTRFDFIDIFKDGWRPKPKPDHTFSKGHSIEELNELRRLYDEYIAYADAEFGRFFDLFSRKNDQDNTWIILTSDHGEMFERGIWEHSTRTLFQPIIRVPLVIFKPGQLGRQDIYSSTSSIDLLPTIMHLTGSEPPAWCEGKLLPPFRTKKSLDREAIFAIEAKSNPRLGPLNVATVAMMKENYKLIKYWGYEGIEDFYELYDLENDPEEHIDLSSSRKSLANDLLEELRLKIEGIENRT